MRRRCLGGREAFTCLDSETEGCTKLPIYAILTERRASMDVEWDELERGWTNLEKRMVDVGVRPLDIDSAEDSVVRLNVGGVPVDMWRYSFKPLQYDGEQQHHQSSAGTASCVLNDLFSGIWDERVPRDPDGRLVIDESPSCVTQILHMFLEWRERAERSVDRSQPSSLSSPLSAPCCDHANILRGYEDVPLLAFLMSTVFGMGEMVWENEELAELKENMLGPGANKPRRMTSSSTPNERGTRNAAARRRRLERYHHMAGVMVDGTPVASAAVRSHDARTAPAWESASSPSYGHVGPKAVSEKEGDVRLLGMSIASTLILERSALKEALKELARAEECVEAAAVALETVYGPFTAASNKKDAVIELTVRGIPMVTMRSTLQACPKSALARMFDEQRWPANRRDLDSAKRRRVLDYSPTCFAKILDVLRLRKRAERAEASSSSAESDAFDGGFGDRGGGVSFLAGNTWYKCRIIVRDADWACFEELVNMFFPDCESFILDLVERSD